MSDVQLIGRSRPEASYRIAGCTVYSATLSLAGVSIPVPVLGLDPGQVNMGMVFLSPSGAAHVYQIFIERGISAVDLIARSALLAESLVQLQKEKPEVAVIEDASYGDVYGQVSLERNRSGAVMGLLQQGVTHIEILPPLTIRKRAMGSAKIDPKSVFAELGVKGPDRKMHYEVASALACALCAVEKWNDRKVLGSSVLSPGLGDDRARGGT